MQLNFTHKLFEKPYTKIILVCLGAFFLGIAFAYLLFGVVSKKTIQKTASPTKVDNYNNLFDTADTSGGSNSKEFGVVLLGSGGAGHSGGGLTDSIIFVHIDPEEKKAIEVSIPRDLYVSGNRKINAEVSVNGVDSIKSLLNSVTGFEVNKYISVDFDGLIKLIDTMGGVEVSLESSYDDYFYPIRGLENELCGKSPEEIAAVHAKYSGFELEKQFECRYEHIHFDTGVTQIDGETALKFARSRHGDSDFGRSKRQFAILAGIVKKLTTQSPFKSIEDAYSALSQIVKTDISLKEAVDLFNFYGSPENYDITQVFLTDQNVLVSSKSRIGEYILLPKSGMNNYDQIREYISKQAGL